MIRFAVAVTILSSSAAGVRAQAPEPADHRATFAAFLGAVNTRDLDALDDLMTAEFTRHSQATPGVVIEDVASFKAFLEADFAAVPDSRVECPMTAAEGDLLAAWCNYTGTQTGQMGPFPPLDRRVELDFASFLRFEEGRIAEMWVTWDNLAMLSQLGHGVPAPEDD